MGHGPVANPAWASDVISRSWPTLQEHVPQWLPRIDLVEPLGETGLLAEAKEYGCGVYGCVYPTLDPNVVMKITTDDTEAEFAANLYPTLVRPICIDYYKVVELGLKHKGHPVFLLWRREATLVGKLYDTIDDEFGRKTGDKVAELVGKQHQAAQSAYAIVSGRDPGDVVSAMNDWVMAVADLAVSGIPILEVLFQGILDVYNEQHIFFGDLHQGNLGAVVTERDARWVITDPGHVAVVDI